MELLRKLPFVIYLVIQFKVLDKPILTLCHSIDFIKQLFIQPFLLAKAFL